MSIDWRYSALLLNGCVLLACSGRVRTDRVDITGESGEGADLDGAGRRIPEPFAAVQRDAAVSWPSDAPANAATTEIAIEPRVETVVEALPEVSCGEGRDCAPYFTRDQIWFLREDGLHVAPRAPRSLPVASALIQDEAAVALGGDGEHTYFLRRTSPGSLGSASDGGSIVNRAERTGLGVLGDYPVLTSDSHGWAFSRGFPRGTTIERLEAKASSQPAVLIQGSAPIDRFVQSDAALLWTESRAGVCRTPALFSARWRDGVATEIRQLDVFSGCSYRLEISGGHGYWVDRGADANQGAIRRVELARVNSAVEPIAEQLNFPEGLAVDEEFVYFTINQEGSVLYRLPEDGSRAAQRITRFPYRIALVDEAFVWGYGGDGTIARVAKH